MPGAACALHPETTRGLSWCVGSPAPVRSEIEDGPGWWTGLGASPRGSRWKASTLPRGQNRAQNRLSNGEVRAIM
ncbi:hypothetical protein GCM10028771_00040 [Nocardioides marmoraquaticus]